MAAWIGFTWTPVLGGPAPSPAPKAQMTAHLQRAALLLDQSRFDLAEAEVRQALATEPQDAWAHSMLALCLSQRKQYQEATQEAQQAIHLAPDFPFAHYTLASILAERDRPEEAVAALSEAIRLNPSEPDFLALLAQIRLSQKQWSESLEASERGLQLDPENVACTNLRAIALVKLGRRKEAGVTIDAALARDPTNPVTHANQGWTLLESGEAQKALEHFREALRLDPENEWARRGIVEALKARYFLYALLLRYFLWMSRFGANAQWGVVLGGYVIYRLLSSLAERNPAWEPWVLPIQIGYLLIVFLTWLADPLFNLALRLNRFGRLALSREQTIASNCVGLCLLAAAVCVSGGLYAGFHGPWTMGTFLFGFLALPVAGAFKCPEGWPRRVAGIYAASLAVCAIGAVLTFLPVAGLPEEATKGLRSLLLGCSVLGIIGSTWLINFLLMAKPKR